MIEEARDLLGVRYRLGGESAEAGFDCSGLVVHVFREAGIELPRTVREISRAGTPVSKADLARGDLVFFNTLRRAYSHVGIYVGEHLFIHAPRPGGAVRIEDLREGYWATRYDSARRVGNFGNRPQKLTGHREPRVYRTYAPAFDQPGGSASPHIRQ